MEKAAEKLDRVGKLLDCNSQLVPLARRQAAEPLAASPYFAAATIEYAGRYFTDWRGHRIRLIRCRMPTPAGRLEPPQEAQHRGGIPLRLNGFPDLVVRVGPQPVECGGEVIPTGLVRKSGMGRRYQFGGEYIQIACRPKRTAERSKLLGDPLDVRLRNDLLQRRNCRTKPPHSHPHLVNAFRLGRERGGLVSQQLGEATAADLSQSRLDRHIGIQNDGLCVNRRGSGVAALHEPIAPLRFAAGLDTKRSHLQQLRGEVVESPRVTALDLQV